MNFNFSANNTTVAINGDLTFTDHGAFLDVMKRLLGTTGSSIAIDLAQVAFIDSAGLGMLLIARDEARKAGRRLILRSPQGQVKRMFAASKFETLFEIET